MKNPVAIIGLSLIGFSSISLANDNKKPFYTSSSSYLDKTSKLYIMENDFVVDEKCKLEVSESKKTAVEYVENDFGQLNWTIQSIQILFSEKFEDSCIHIIHFISRNNNGSSYLKVGIDMNGKLIKPIVESGPN